MIYTSGVLSDAEVVACKQKIDDYCSTCLKVNRAEATRAFKRLMALPYFFDSRGNVNEAHAYLLHAIKHGIDIDCNELINYALPVERLKDIDVESLSDMTTCAILQVFARENSDTINEVVGNIPYDKLYKVVEQLLLSEDSEENLCLAYYLCEHLFCFAHVKTAMLIEQLSFAEQIKYSSFDDDMTVLVGYDQFPKIQAINDECYVLMQTLRDNCSALQFSSALLESKLRHYRIFGGEAKKRLECEELLARIFLTKEVTLGSVSFFVNRAVKFQRATRNYCVYLIAQHDILKAKHACEEIYELASDIMTEQVGAGIEVCNEKMDLVKQDMEAMLSHINAKNINALRVFESQTKKQAADDGRLPSFMFNVGKAAVRKLYLRIKPEATPHANTVHV